MTCCRLCYPSMRMNRFCRLGRCIPCVTSIWLTWLRCWLRWCIPGIWLTRFWCWLCIICSSICFCCLSCVILFFIIQLFIRWRFISFNFFIFRIFNTIWFFYLFRYLCAIGFCYCIIVIFPYDCPIICKFLCFFFIYYINFFLYINSL